MSINKIYTVFLYFVFLDFLPKFVVKSTLLTANCALFVCFVRIFFYFSYIFAFRTVIVRSPNYWSIFLCLSLHLVHLFLSFSLHSCSLYSVVCNRAEICVVLTTFVTFFSFSLQFLDICKKSLILKLAGNNCFCSISAFTDDDRIPMSQLFFLLIFLYLRFRLYFWCLCVGGSLGLIGQI